MSRSSEITRLVGMARRDLAVYDEAFAEALSLELVRPGAKFRLKPSQAASLVEAVEAGGLLSRRAVGGGKTVSAPLFGKVMQLAPFVLLVPSQMKTVIEGRIIPWLEREIGLGEHRPIVVSYEELSTAGKGDVLDRIRPALIVADEAHKLKNKNAARTRRFLRYFAEEPETAFVAMSGTFASRSIMEFWHLVLLTHKRNPPITRSWREAKDWSLALDPHVREDERMRPGALLELCRPGEDARDGFRRRLGETEGVIDGDSNDEVGASLVFRKLRPRVPSAVEDALVLLEKKWETPGGEKLTDALDFARKAREIAQGFYYVWDWPDGSPDTEWLAARSAWRAAVASVCKLNRDGLDSELLVRNAAERELRGTWLNGARLPKASREIVVDAWRAWGAVRDREEPPTRAIWIDDFLVRYAIEWTQSNERGIVWYDSRAFEDRVRSLGTGMPVYVVGSGDAGNRELLALADREAPPSVFCSQPAHGTGKNLQRWCRALVVAPWSGGGTHEQVIGREHRPGQDEDEVVVDYCVHCAPLEAALGKALEDARFIQETTGNGQKLLLGTWLDS